MGELDLGAVRAFVAVAENRHFGEAAVELGITQQAVSKRVAKLEADLGTVLLSRLRTGTGLSRDGDRFLPHARNLLEAADRAAVALRRERPLRVDVLDTRLATTELMRAYHETGVDVDVVTSDGLRTARSTLKAGTVDAAFARVTVPLDGVRSTPVHLEPMEVLVGTGHPWAGRGAVTMADLAGVTAWMPGNERGSEWAEFWEVVGAEFGVRIDTTGPNFGYEHMVAAVAASTDRISFIGEQCRMPEHPGVVRLPVHPPRPAYPWSLLWHRHNRHAALPGLVAHVRAGFRPQDPAQVWLPDADLPAFRP
ncbi:LysR family transcriptional regulator [Actinokineospora sp. PR83]|uniref:LysR family transcriptional regulator n=1 Tax=Actinokineospora sp. PR83 TaxID=2884908 RepID=UPI0027E15BE4|nr:LysR family transcriptional regulator [Actinokineospora sp. PR83]MCG8915728.1 LysR family transcriptional regulator [Actinokineospora sp. PR83]